MSRRGLRGTCDALISKSALPVAAVCVCDASAAANPAIGSAQHPESILSKSAITEMVSRIERSLLRT